VARIAVLGEPIRIQGFGLAGALLLPAEDPGAVNTAWDRLPADVAVAVLTSRAADALGDRRAQRRWPLTVVMPP
jgi:hypothetical protein